MRVPINLIPDDLLNRILDEAFTEKMRREKDRISKELIAESLREKGGTNVERSEAEEAGE